MNDPDEDTGKKVSTDVVDGQQRLLTVALFIIGIKERLVKLSDKQQLPASSIFNDVSLKFISKLRIKNELSIQQLQRNSVLVKQQLASFDIKQLEALAYFILKHCSVVFIQLSDLSEAFQFFDSQNARGKALEPYDLLKAYHLREMLHEPDLVNNKLISQWEFYARNDGQLKEVFDNYLYRIRQWIKHKPARYFSNDDIELFKGINPDNETSPPYFAIYRLSHHFTDNYNSDRVRKNDQKQLDYPFTLNQVILNGRRFFNYVDHYIELLNFVINKPELQKYFHLINSYDGRTRKGDKYTKNLFQAILLFYVDKFGCHHLEQAGKVCFLWAYKMRLDRKSVQLATMDNYAVTNDSLFTVIDNSLCSKDVRNYLQVPLTMCNATKMGEIEEFFIENGVLLK
ncbi:MAG: hypothetical protein OFPII_00780 [Osedax symbiont Rs1]|nr:MAG: hypothetical protein OFPII_00780 [Osedax symbiont Rs1]